ncbi:acyltransferase [Clostridium transplantifaecale]|uniref:acyltransferase n=1 Tax=Clostridium transplantifaecale TaxID=2479838 RepID=UPI0019D21B34|nr:acyltransferase [Clostridium transplantifaecale]
MIRIITICICIYAIIKVSCKTLAYLISMAWFTRESKRPVKETVRVPNQNTKMMRGGGKSWKQAAGRIVSGVNKYVAADIGRIPSHLVRMGLYKTVLKVGIEKDVVIYKGTFFRDGYKCHIGAGTIIGDDNMIDSRGTVRIGKNCNFSTGVRIWTAQHDLQSEDFRMISDSVSIGDRCWISGNVTILPGVTVEDGCVIASGAVVTKDCTAFGVYAGVPARRIGERSKKLSYEFKGTHNWFL